MYNYIYIYIFILVYLFTSIPKETTIHKIGQALPEASKCPEGNRRAPESTRGPPEDGQRTARGQPGGQPEDTGGHQRDQGHRSAPASTRGQPEDRQGTTRGPPKDTGEQESTRGQKQTRRGQPENNQRSHTFKTRNDSHRTDNHWTTNCDETQAS